MKKISALLILLILFYSCSKQEQGLLIDNSLQLSFINTQGEDLLDPETVNSIKVEEIEMYYLKDNKMVRANDSRLDNPKMFSVYYSNTREKNVLSFLSSLYLDDKNQATTYLKLKSDDIDTITCKMHEYNPTLVTEAFYNGELIILNQIKNDFAVIIKDY